MAYTLFFLIGMPLWLVASARMFRAEVHSPLLKLVWAGSAFLAPMLIFGAGALAQTLVQQHASELATWPRGFGYFIVVLNIFAFFSCFVVQSAFNARYGPQRHSAGDR